MGEWRVGTVGRRIAVVAIAVASGFGALAWKLQDGASSGSAGRVATVRAVRGDVIVSVRAIGRVIPADRGSILPVASTAGSSAPTASTAGTSRLVLAAVGGRVLQVLVAPGARVRVGQPIARLDATAARSAVVAARASLKQAQVQLTIDHRGVDSAHSQADQARIQLRIDQSNVVSAQEALDQAGSQLALDRRGAGVQSVAAARSTETAAAVALASARAALRSSERVNRDAIGAAGEQVAQAREQLRMDRRTLLPPSQSTAAARVALAAAQASLVTARQAYDDAVADSAQQLTAAQHALDGANQTHAIDSAQLERALTTERFLCGANAPTITVDTSGECANAAAAVAAGQQSVVRDRVAAQSAADGLAQVRIGAARVLRQASAQVAVAAREVRSADAQLAALERSNAASLVRNRQARAAVVAKDRAALETARWSLRQAQSRATESIGQARGQLRSAAAAFDAARASLRAVGRGAPRPLIDQSLSRVRAARALVEAARSTIAQDRAKAAAAEAQVGAAEALLAQDRSKIVAARAQLASSLAASAQSVVAAPFSGTVVDVFVAQGTTVDVATPVAAIADISRLAVSLDLSEFDIARVRPRMPATLSVDGLGGRRFSGEVEFTSLSGVESGGVVTFPVRVAVRRASGVLLGMNVNARIIVARRSNVVTVPLETLTEDDQGRTSVSVVGAAGETSSRVVVVGLTNNKDAEIKRGLRAGERVALPTAEGV